MLQEINKLYNYSNLLSTKQNYKNITIYIIYYNEKNKYA